MIKNKTLFLIGSLFALTLFLSFGQVKAHNPSSMTLEYNESSEIFNVTISHSSEDFNTHYIYEVIIIMDDFQIYNQSYSGQPSNVFTYNYFIDARPLELLSFVIEVTARCTQGGIITRSLTIGQENVNIPGFIGLLFIIRVSTIIMIAIFYKKLSIRVVKW